jgi:phosphotransferase system HPr (HPr) family protein
MKFIDVIIRQPHGLHLRVASAIARKIKEYKAEVFISKDDKTAKADSVLGMMMLEATENSKIHVTAHGEDEQAAVKDIGEFFTDGAGI